jgi:hypothetical protein
VLELVLLAVLLTFIAVVALAAALLAVRSARRSRSERRVWEVGDVADAIRAFRRSGDTAALADALSTVSVSVLLAVIPRTLGELNCREREAFETALARRRFAAYLRENFRGSTKPSGSLPASFLRCLAANSRWRS